MRMTESKMLVSKLLATKLAIKTAQVSGRMCLICPVNSHTITVVEIVCVAAPENAAAPTTA